MKAAMPSPMHSCAAQARPSTRTSGERTANTAASIPSHRGNRPSLAANTIGSASGNHEERSGEQHRTSDTGDHREQGLRVRSPRMFRGLVLPALGAVVDVYLLL